MNYMHTQGLGNAELLAEGEVGNTLSQDNCGVSDKKGTADFALWKKSKEGNVCHNKRLLQLHRTV
jgi:cysteinyl-tRNA synthetase